MCMCVYACVYIFFNMWLAIRGQGVSGSSLPNIKKMGSNTRETIPDGPSQHLSTSFGSALMASRRLHRVLLNFSSSKCL